jgi:glyoxylase-like metal-dependent hydrolase (beta-lactamase superfamily II)
LPYETIPETESITLIDTEMFGETGFTAAYLFESDKTLLVDAGLYENGPDIERTLMDIGAPPEELDYLAISHLHLDHAGGATYLAAKYPELSVLCHSLTADFLTDPDKLESLFESGQSVMADFADSYGEASPIEPDRITILEDRDRIDLGGRELITYEATGHAPHQICFYDEDEEVLFLADEGCAQMNGEAFPTTPPPDFDYERTLKSLDTFIDLNPQTLLYSHFGYNTEGVERLAEHQSVLEEWVGFIDDLRGEGLTEDAIIDRVIEMFAENGHGNFRKIIKRDTRGVLKYLEEDS